MTTMRILSILALGTGVLAAPSAAQSGNPEAIRPFKVHVPDEALADLRRRIAATRWPAKETVTDRSQGVQLQRLRALLGYWGTEYDWRKVEAKLNALPQFVTTIDGLDIHFIQVKSRHPNALPLIMTHGWPGSVTPTSTTGSRRRWKWWWSSTTARRDSTSPRDRKRIWCST